MTTTLPKDTHPTTLRGPLLWLMRVVWVVLVGLGMGFAISMAPAYIHDAPQNWQIQQSYPAVAGFLSLSQYTTYILGLRYGLALLYFLVGFFIFLRKSNDWLALLVAFSLALMPLAQNLVGFVDAEFGLPWSQTWHRIYHAVRALAAVSYVFIFFLFPRGGLSRWPPRWLQIILLASVSILGLITALQSESDWGVDPMLNRLLGIDPFAIFLLLFIAASACGILAQISAYRSSTEAQQRQLKWAVLGLTVSMLLNLITLLGYLIPKPHSAWIEFGTNHLNLFAATIVPLAFGIAILRHHLWDIDLVIRRALVYGALIGIIAGVYVAVVGGLGVLVNQVGSPFTTALATGLIAVMFNPLRTRLQRTVNRTLYGYRDDPAALLSQLGQHLESAATPEATLAHIVETLARALKLPYVALTDASEPAQFLTAFGQAKLPHISLPTFALTYQGETIGCLLAAPRAAGEALSREDQRVLQALARQLAPAVRAARLTQELQHSRQRIVSAREEERRRIRRDLHDGLGPTLASQTLKLDAAIDLIETQPRRAAELLRQLKLQTQTVVADVRRLVYELRPPALDEVGLVGAIRNFGFSISDFRLEVHAQEPLPQLPAAVEVAAYRIATEAMTNVVKHAQAKICSVTISVIETRRIGFAASLQVEVSDDGVGLPEERPIGIGLRSMRERAEELGGQLVIESVQPHGTRVAALLPISNP